MEPVVVYSNGIVHCSVCTSIKNRKKLTDAVNAMNPTGIRSRWQIAEDKAFRTGEPNPCPCEQDPRRKHYLFTC
jgi:hypothetical protein